MNEIPLWLNLKKEYVDDNFEPLLNYLNQARHEEHDLFYDRTLNLLRERCLYLVSELEATKVFEEDPPVASIDFNLRLLAAYLLVSRDDDRNKDIFLGLLHQLHLRFPSLSERILAKMSEVLKAGYVISPGVTFRNVLDYTPEVFAHLVLEHSVCSTLIDGQMLYEGNGRAWLNCGGLTLTATGTTLSEERKVKFAYSLETPADCRIGSFRGDKLKFIDSRSHAAIENFVDDFVRRQREPLKQDPKHELRKLQPGEETVVEIVSILYNGSIFVKTVDPDCELIRGQIEFPEKYIAMYKTDLLHKNFRVGNRVRAFYTHAEGNKHFFNLDRQLEHFLVEDMRSSFPDSEAGPFYALLKIITPKIYYWLSDRGVGVRTFADPKYKGGDIAMLRIKNYEDGLSYGKINAEIVGDPEKEFFEETGFDEHEVRFDAIQAFVDSTPEVKDSEPEELEEPSISRSLLALTARIFYLHQRELKSPSERLNYLANARIIAELLGDKLLSDFLKFTSTYLRGVVAFVEGMPMDDLTLTPAPEFEDTEAVGMRLAIIDLLKEYGRRDYSELLARTIERESEEEPDALLPKLARLINASNSLQDTLSPASLNIIKREIIRSLSIENKDDVDLEADGRAYIGMENQTMEFKTSMVFPPNYNMQPNQQQQTFNVFRAICGFLNSTVGGTLYVGVSDSGYVCGLEQDFTYLKCHSLDSYMRVHIQDPLIREFGLDVMNYIHVDSAYDDQVVMIRVEPHPFRIVELQDVAYQRFDRETREMTERAKAELMTKKMVRDRDKAEAILQLQHAMFKKRVAVIRDYADPDEGRLTDLRVEPYAIMPEDGIALCLECKTLKCRPLRIAQMGYVGLDEESKWQSTHLHRPIEIDAFHSFGPKDIPVSLELDYYAKTRMIKEYPRTKDDIQPCKGDDNVWYFTGKVRSMEGIGQFYLAHSDHIRILDAPALEDYARSKARINFSVK
ncbi:MAG: ATP-binding protein [Muribaculaceae bacterium]|nr:ATP-binding protein [Muribaculaceae bacterium]